MLLNNPGIAAYQQTPKNLNQQTGNPDGTMFPVINLTIFSRAPHFF